GSGLRGRRQELLAQRARVHAGELLRIARQVVVEVRQPDGHVVVEDLLDLGAGRLLGVDADRLLELGEGRVEVRRGVLRRVPDARGLERAVEEDVRGGAVAVVDDAELGRAGARRVGRGRRAPRGAVELAIVLAVRGDRDPGRLGLTLDQDREVGDLV